MDAGGEGGGEGWMEDQWEKWLTHDISLDEFEDDDLSEITEITDEHGVSLNCNGLELKAHVRRGTNGMPGRAELGAVGLLQAEMLHLERIAGADRYRGYDAESCSASAVPPPSPGSRVPVTMDTYRPKRPTTLNLFPVVPRTQDTLNNNSFGKKYSWQEKVSLSSSPLKAGALSPHEHSCLSDEDRLQGGGVGGGAPTRDRGTSTDGPCRHTMGAGLAGTGPVGGTRSKLQEGHVPPPQHRERVRCHGDARPEPTEEIYLTPPQRPPLAPQGERGLCMSVSSDAEAPPPYQPPSPLGGAEEEELYGPPSYASCVEAPATPPWGGGGGGASTWGGAGGGTSPWGASGLSYDAVKYTLVVDEHAQLELGSLRRCYRGYSHDEEEEEEEEEVEEGSDATTVCNNCPSSPYEPAVGEEYEEPEEGGEEPDEEGGACTEVGGASQDSTPSSDLSFSKKFLNVFMNGRPSSAESFGLFSCLINGQERDQTHRAVYRFIPRHDDELELEVDDPLLVEVEADDHWYEGYNMRTCVRGAFPSYYAVEVARDPGGCTEHNSRWTDRYWLKFLGSVQVPYHKGNDVLCAAMQKIATNRRMTLQYNPPSSCMLEINVKGIKLVVQDDYEARGNHECSHFFQLKNVSFCGYHPKNSKYFGFITKHPADQRFACHVFVSENSTKPLAESVGKAFQSYYKEYVEASCPTEDIYLE